MSRAEFSKPTKREAWKRSGGLCEASGWRYGLSEGRRCMGSLSKGVIYDHDDPDANSKDASLENCRCICLICNVFKTNKVDIPMIAKTVRQQDKTRGIEGKAKWTRPMPGTIKSGLKKLFDGRVVKR